MYQCEKCGARPESGAQFCSNCGQAVFAKRHGKSDPKATWPKPWHWVVVLAVIFFAFMGTSRDAKNPGPRQDVPPSSAKYVRTIRYIIELPCGMHEGQKVCSSSTVTYINGSGGTEQVKAVGPWDLEMRQNPGTFVSVSAQAEDDYPAPQKVSILVDGQVLQSAQSIAGYGIASASGIVP